MKILTNFHHRSKKLNCLGTIRSFNSTQKHMQKHTVEDQCSFSRIIWEWNHAFSNRHWMLWIMHLITTFFEFFFCKNCSVAAPHSFTFWGYSLSHCLIAIDHELLTLLLGTERSSFAPAQLDSTVYFLSPQLTLVPQSIFSEGKLYKILL